ncbi:aminotransferase class III-fold pyridoxal phosphate-dependent enzyme [Arcanobacterium ihumii]|uniref:aminotransferase class III-fold pyridoxal phosphate-dependent enzyme n=1 Tax=Arcanobacterium ihumii TaxID=2138162 RepID=UPI000F534812|nr:aminotransferase class III-fold pyridoxal phosphate-dependent enzyme [Arcanobacterium ihumii]
MWKRKFEHALWQPSCSPQLLIEDANGAHVRDCEDRSFLDLTSGFGANLLGYRHKRISEYVKNNADMLFETPQTVTSHSQISLASDLQACLTESGYVGASARVRFTRSGHEANRAALEIALQFKPQGNIVTVSPVYSDRELYGVVAPVVTFEEASLKSHENGSSFGDSTKIISIKPSVELLEQVVDEDTAAVILDPFSWCHNGILDEEIFRRSSALCERFNALLILDETQLGLGRTGDWFVHVSHVKADVITVGRGLGGGTPLGATLLLSRRAMQDSDRLSAMVPAGNPMNFGIASVVLEEIRLLLPNIDELGSYLKESFQDLGYDVFGNGLLLGISVANAEVFQKVLFDRGFVVNAASNTVIKLLPPLNIAIADVQEFLHEMEGLVEQIG